MLRLLSFTYLRQSLFGISLFSGTGVFFFRRHFQRICITGVCFTGVFLVTLNRKTSFLSDEVMRKSWQSVHIGYGFYLPSGLSAELAAVGTVRSGVDKRIIQTVQVLLCTPLYGVRWSVYCPVDQNCVERAIRHSPISTNPMYAAKY